MVKMFQEACMEVSSGKKKKEKNASKLLEFLVSSFNEIICLDYAMRPLKVSRFPWLTL